MKHYLLLTLATAGLLTFSGCATDDDDAPQVQSTTTTTEETRVQPSAGTTQTQTVRTY